MSQSLFVVVPTFRELNLVRSFLVSWKAVRSLPLTLIVCNARPGDESSAHIREISKTYPHRIIEVEGHSDLYWSGLVELGLKRVLDISRADDLCLVTNIDITFQGDPVLPMLKANKANPKSQIAALAIGSGNRLLSSGVCVRSWALSINHHPFRGASPEAVPGGSLIDVTYLPTRFVLFPVLAVKEAGFPRTKRLPHYCADFEYTNRLRRYGFQSYITTDAVVMNDQSNTGFKTFENKTTFTDRWRNMFQLKCTYYLPSRFWFVWYTYPGLMKLPGLISGLTKVLLEILVGGHRLRS